MIEPWTVLEEREAFAARPYVSVIRERVQLGSGVIIDDFYKVELADFALCVPQLPGGKIVMLWEYKHGARRCGLGFPAGLIDPDETPLETSRRELFEETGYRAALVEPLGSYVDNGNQRGSRGHYFIGRDCRQESLPEHNARETAELRLMWPDEIDRALAAGDFSVVHHVAAWALARPRLIERTRYES